MLTVASTRAHADTKQIVTLDVAALPLGAVHLAYKLDAVPLVRLNVPFEFQSLALFPFGAEPITVSRTVFGFGVLPDLSVSTGIGVQVHMLGWYIEPQVGFGYARIDYPSQFGTQHTYMQKMSIHMGYASELLFGVYVDASVGMTGRVFFPEHAASAVIQPSARFQVGYAW